ncbi:uncharacterized protein LOC129976483 [Argiope bruennichi]|uniref:uncharacterized protein LOC129976483 n=1 Tax=Argiope bruennichi TaxID=94029 RepID=UPI00249596ED|nr:uncharacterized protein LOC129976483 [Argiope bruennichi]
MELLLEIGLPYIRKVCEEENLQRVDRNFVKDGILVGVGALLGFFCGGHSGGITGATVGFLISAGLGEKTKPLWLVIEAWPECLQEKLIVSIFLSNCRLKNSLGAADLKEEDERELVQLTYNGSLTSRSLNSGAATAIILFCQDEFGWRICGENEHS